MLDIGLFTPNGPIIFSYHGSACSWNSQTERGPNRKRFYRNHTWHEPSHMGDFVHNMIQIRWKASPNVVPLCRTGPPSPQYPLEPTRSQVVSRGNQRSECKCHEGLCWAEAEAYKNMQKMLQTTWNGFSHGHMAGSPPSRRVYDTSNIPQQSQDLQSQSVHPHAGALLTARAASSAQGMAKIIRSHVKVKTVAIRTKHLQILQGFQLHRMRGCINLDYRYLTVSRKPVCHSIRLYCLCICVCLSLFIWLCARALTHINEWLHGCLPDTLNNH